MIRWLVRLVIRLVVRWVVADLVVRWVVRRFGRRRVEQASADLEVLAAERLPQPVARAVAALPPEAKNVGGSAVVAARAARSAATTSRQVARVAGTASRGAAAVPGAARGLADRVRDETEASRRRLRSQYLAETVGPEAGTDALLDVRTAPPSGVIDLRSGDPTSRPDDEVDPHATVPGPISVGRRRFRPRPPQLVNRMRRSYRPASKAWDDQRDRTS